MDVAMPAWLLAIGYSTEAVASFNAIAGLPWSLKAFVGPVLDTWTCRRFGYRRPYIILAQVLLVVSLFAMGVTVGVPIDLRLLTACGFFVLSSSAVQDVATDGLAIDVLREDEQGQANALMATSKTLGGSLMGAIAGNLLPVTGLTVVTTIVALLVLPVLVNIILTLERPGERRLPESHCMPETGPTGTSVAIVASNLEPTFCEKALSLIRGLLLSASSLLVLSTAIFSELASGIVSIMYPKLSLTLGISSAAYASIVSTSQVITAALGIGCGVIVDKLGADKVYLGGVMLGVACKYAIVIFVGREQVTRTNFVVVLFSELVAGQIRSVSYLAFCMRLCSTSLAAATQYCVMMACSNLASSVGIALVATGILKATGDWLWLAALLMTGGTLCAALLTSVETKPRVSSSCTTEDKQGEVALL